MTLTYLSLFLIYLFSIFNLIGIRPDLVIDSIIYFFLGIFLFFLVRFLLKDFIIENSQFFYWLIIVFLILVFLIGSEIRGVKRWLTIYTFNFQPSEFFKVFFTIYLAKLYSQVDRISQSPRLIFLKTLILFVIPFFLIYKEPDLGTAMIIAFLYLALSLFSPLPKKYFLRMFILLIILIPIFWHFLADYQKIRVISFLNPHYHSLTTSYNMVQSIITIGSGGFFGKGLGFGTQTRLNFLPEDHTDFAFASFIEQFGFFGGLLLLTFYFLFFYSLIQLIKKYLENIKKNLFHFYYVLGIITIVFFQFFINVAMNLGIAPVAGIPLPFFSYGGSSLISLMLAISFINNKN